MPYFVYWAFEHSTDAILGWAEPLQTQQIQHVARLSFWKHRQCPIYLSSALCALLRTVLCAQLSRTRSESLIVHASLYMFSHNGFGPNGQRPKALRSLLIYSAPLALVLGPNSISIMAELCASRAINRESIGNIYASIHFHTPPLRINMLIGNI